MMDAAKAVAFCAVNGGDVNDYISGRSEPTLKIARLLCRVLNISPAAMLGY